MIEFIKTISRLFLIILILDCNVVISSEFENSVDIMNSKLFLNVKRNNLSDAVYLINKGASINATSLYKETILMRSVLFNRENFVKFLLEKGASVDSVNYAGDTALMRAVYLEKTAISRMLINNGADVDIQNIYGETAISRAISKLKNNHLRLLLECEADIYVINEHNQDLIDISIDVNNLDAITLLNLQKSIYENNNLVSSINKLSLLDFHWFVNRVINNRNIYDILPDDYKLMFDFYKELKSGNITEDKIIDILENKDKLSKRLKKIKRTLAYKYMMLDLIKILLIHSRYSFCKQSLPCILNNLVRKILNLKNNKIKAYNRAETIIPISIASNIIIDY